MDDKLTIAELFAFSRYSAVEELKRNLALKQERQQNHLKELSAQRQILNRMQQRADAQTAGSLYSQGFPAASYMLGNQGISPEVIQMAAAMANRR